MIKDQHLGSRVTLLGVGVLKLCVTLQGVCVLGGGGGDFAGDWCLLFVFVSSLGVGVMKGSEWGLH